MTHNEAKKRAKALVSQMTVEEKASQLIYNSPAIERLGIHEYNWWNEGSHGVARAGTATVFPHAIALAATFDPEGVRKVADIISTEARVKYNSHVKYNDYDIYKGLTFWTPNINIFRDPRWGRGQETFGEDPFLTSTLGVQYVKGLQGDGEFLKTSSCSKHFAAHSGPEAQRHCFNAEVDMHDLWETYLPAFEKTVEAGVSGVMGAYNRTNGEPCCAHSYLMTDVLRGKWGFDGYFTSDCWALSDFYKETGHKIVETREEAAAMALKATCDLNCGSVYEKIMDAYESDLITEDDITAAAERLFTIRFLLGEFEENRPFSDLPHELLDCEEHRKHNLKMAQESMVLLKNEKGFLPLSADVKKIAVIGPNAMSIIALEGNYHGVASEYVTVADGIRREYPNSSIKVEMGCKICKEKKNDYSGFGNQISDGIATAADADVTVLCLGLDKSVEGEETGIDDDYTCQGDKKTLYLPQTQIKLAEAVCDVCENVIVVMLCGSAIDMGEKLRNHAKAIIYGWYPGAVGGLAVAQLISGKFSPSGRLPVTIYYGDADIPDFTDYSMKNRTYRYYTGEPLYPFGYGLSYTSFEYSSFTIDSKDEERVKVSFELENTGKMSGMEKAQIYASFTDSRTRTPRFQLCGIKAVELDAGEKKTVTVDIDRYWLSAVLDSGERVSPDGEIKLFVGGSQPDERSEALTGKKCIAIKL
ncbi:MAG: glycoside hydrolase family 3 C-terminal domain-containing protein [Clostridia bacterium]|nr:glycoside hydrolase family 3 C-terminal domain-containing protein [Clostridia bacterium]